MLTAKKLEIGKASRREKQMSTDMACYTSMVEI